MSLHNEIYQALTDPGDLRIKLLIQGDLNVDMLTTLFSPYIERSGFDLRYISQGRSGAGVILVFPQGGGAFVIKFGEQKDIETEVDNYKKVREVINSNILPQLKTCGASKKEFSEYREYAATAYSWAGGNSDEVLMLRDYIREENTDSILIQLESLLNDMFAWHQVRKGAQLPYDQWKWEKGIEPITQEINGWDKDESHKERLAAALRVENEWRRKLQGRAPSIGTCHGDLNTGNVLMVKNPAHTIPKLIDFASVCSDTTPAKDWVKVERDIKFRFLRKVVKNSLDYRKSVERIDNICNRVQGLTPDADAHIEKACKTISLIRKEYAQKTAGASDLPYLEYLFYLFLTTLNYAANDDFSELEQEDAKEDVAVFRHAVLDSAYRTLEQIDAILSQDISSTYPGFQNISQSGTREKTSMNQQKRVNIEELKHNQSKRYIIIEEEIVELLEYPDMELFCQELKRVMKFAEPPSPGTVARKLIEYANEKGICDAVDLLTVAVDRCFKKVRVLDKRYAIWKVAVNIAGWLVLLSVGSKESIWEHIGDEGIFNLPNVQELGIEIIVSWLFTEKACFRKVDFGLMGGEDAVPSSYEIGKVEEGGRATLEVDKIKKVIWETVISATGESVSKQLPEHFSPHYDKRLNALLESRWKLNHKHYFVVKNDQDKDIYSDHVCKILKEQLPSLVIIHTGNKDIAGLLCSEDELSSKIFMLFSEEPR